MGDSSVYIGQLRESERRTRTSVAKQIEKQIADLKDWRGKMLAQLRKALHEADPEIVEEWKWGTAIFAHDGMVCALGSFKDHIKVNFFKGASLKDPHKLFNAGFEAKATRAIDLHENDKIAESQFKDLIREAVDNNKKK